MKLGEVRVAEDEDFEKLKKLNDSNEGWKLEYSKHQTFVFSQMTDQSDFRMIKIKSVYKDVRAAVLFDVLLDPVYRKVWDTCMLESYDIGNLNPNNDVGYYAVRCPSPMKNRDFVLQRSWLDTGKEYLVLNHSVYHESVPPKKDFVRGISYLTGFIILPLGDKGCDLFYVTQCDPKGSLPVWLVNKLTQIFAPKMVKKLHKACLGYESWKRKNNPQWKPWLNPEQIPLPLLQLSKCIRSTLHDSSESLDESGINESIESANFFDNED